MKKKAFTLIELLVVIAIMGILAAIILVALNSARNSGKATRIISDLRQTKTQLESFNLDTGYYGGYVDGTLAGGTVKYPNDSYAISCYYNHPDATGQCDNIAYSNATTSSSGRTYTAETIATKKIIYQTLSDAKTQGATNFLVRGIGPYYLIGALAPNGKFICFDHTSKVSYNSSYPGWAAPDTTNPTLNQTYFLCP